MAEDKGGKSGVTFHSGPGETAAVNMNTDMPRSTGSISQQPDNITALRSPPPHALKQGHSRGRSAWGALEGIDHSGTHGASRTSGAGAAGGSACAIANKSDPTDGAKPKTKLKPKHTVLTRRQSDETETAPSSGAVDLIAATTTPPEHATKQGHSTKRSALAAFSGGDENSKHGLAGDDRHDKEDTAVSTAGENDDDDDVDADVRLVEEQFLAEEESYARENAETRPLMIFFWDGLSSLIVFARYLISIDSLLSVALSCGLTYYLYEKNKHDDDFDGTMSFVLLGFAVIMPLSASVRMVFNRRELALKNIASLQTNAHAIYMCHASWDWGKSPGGRSEDPSRWLRHSDEVLRVLISIGDGLTRFLTLPNSSFSRHRETKAGRREAAVSISTSHRIFGEIVENGITDLGLLTEELKLGGFSASEASRVRQYEKLTMEAIHNLRMLKMYRSPKALDALLNLTVTLLPPFYAPAYAQVARDTGSLELAFVFAAATSLVLEALYRSVQVLEDPFVAFLTLDGIDVYEELAVMYYHQLIQTRRRIFRSASMFLETRPDYSNAQEKDATFDTFDENEKVPEPPRRSSLQRGSRRTSLTISALQRQQRPRHRQSAFELDLPEDWKAGSTSRMRIFGETSFATISE